MTLTDSYVSEGLKPPTSLLFETTNQFLMLFIISQDMGMGQNGQNLRPEGPQMASSPFK